MTEESPHDPAPESDFELDLDRVFKPAQAAPAQVPSRIPPKPRPAGGDAAPQRPEDAEPAPPRRGGKATFERRADDATKDFRRVVARPSTILAANELNESPPLSSAGENGAASVEAPSGKRRPREEMPGLQVDRARAVLEDTFHVAPLPPEGNWPRRLLMLAAILAGGFAVWYAASTAWKSHQLSLEEQRPAEEAAAAAVERLSQARKVMQSYVEAKTVTDKVKHVLEPERVRPLMVEFYEIQRRTDPAFPWAKVVSQSPRVIGGRYWFAFQFKSAPDAPPVEMSLRETANGYKIDWLHFVSHGARPWDKFCDERPQTPTQMRLCAKPLPNAPKPYLNSVDFDCYQLEHYSKPVRLLGYAAKTDRVFQDLKKLFEKDKQPKVLNVYLRFEPLAERDQVRIVDLAPDFRP